MDEARPFSQEELWTAFHGNGSISKHLLTLYSMVHGLRARQVGEIGLGTTTRALRLAVRETGGVLHTCDCDAQRYSHLLEQQDEHWKLSLCASESFLDGLEAPLDLFVHDGAHDYFQVTQDLKRILPLMRTFGLVCVHDTQQIELADDMLAALRDGCDGWDISLTLLPYFNGLAIIRVEQGAQPPVTPAGDDLPDGRFATRLVSVPLTFSGPSTAGEDRSFKRWLRWRLLKLVKGW